MNSWTGLTADQAGPDHPRYGAHTEVRRCAIEGALLLAPTPQRSEHELFVYTFDARIAVQHGLDPAMFRQEAQARCRHGMLRGLHLCTGLGERKLVRCSYGAVHDVLVDARPRSPTFGRHEAFRLDDVSHLQLYVPTGVLHGFQSLTGTADVCFRVDREHDPTEHLVVRHDDPDLNIVWPLPVTAIAPGDAQAISWADLRARLPTS